VIILLAFYIPLLLLALGYVVVNVFHLLRFRLPLRGDFSWLMLVLYLLIVLSALIGSFTLGLIAYNLS